jgi:hypothetical protein
MRLVCKEGASLIILRDIVGYVGSELDYIYRFYTCRSSLGQCMVVVAPTSIKSIYVV